VGAGGHAEAILGRSVPGGQLLGIDADPTAIEIAQERLRPYRGSFLLINDNFKRVEDICKSHNFWPVHGILLDLGLSSLQLEEGLGFSFRQDTPLDMRFDPSQTLTAADIVNTLPEGELADLLARYGEERRCHQIARHIVQDRPLSTTAQLANAVEEAVGTARGRIHPATKTFQALRIAVNRELENLESALQQTTNLLGFGGRLVIISFHSLEDRLVKQFLHRESQDCLCPPGTPVCICGHAPTLKIVTKKVIRPSEAEKVANPRSRSAKMRVGERI
jgi:16S rRNA (cytosine1402-N4)-methyltransferase